MNSTKVISIAERELPKPKEDKIHRERNLLRYIETVENALRKTGADPLTLPFIFLELSMILCDRQSIKKD